MKYKAGDKVTIRGWEVIKREYGVRYANNILPEYLFSEGMKKFCGRQLRIKQVFDNSYRMEEVVQEYSFTDEMIAHNFTYGERIRVWDDKENEERIFVGFLDGAIFPYICVDYGSEQDFLTGERVQTLNWQQAEKIPATPKIDIKVTINNKEIDPKTISKKTWTNLRGEK